MPRNRRQFRRISLIDNDKFESARLDRELVDVDAASSTAKEEEVGFH